MCVSIECYRVDYASKYPFFLYYIYSLYYPFQLYCTSKSSSLSVRSREECPY